MANITNKVDRRARLTAKTAPDSDTFLEIFGQNVPENILQPLHRTRGVIFPYTPNVVWQNSAEYQDMQMTHSNFNYQVFQRSNPGPIQCDAMFTAQTDIEARYLLAVMHFFKTITKMYFGEQAGNMAGIPPPVMRFNYLGKHMMNDIPVVVRGVQYTLGNDVDYVPVRFADKHENDTYVPTQINIALELGIQMNTKTVREQFNLETFRSGSYLEGEGEGSFKGWI